MQTKKKKIDIKRPERALLTDTLPYEIPVFFTNENLAVLAYSESTQASDYKLHKRYLLHAKNNRSTRPLMFEIKKDSKSYRRLGIPHPRSQHLLSIFYGENENFITNSCARSTFSLRYPSRVATHYVDSRYGATSQNQGNAADEDPVGFKDQTRWASTYFSYREYNLSHKFFESEQFLDLERQFSTLRKLDISKCFDSIYTHSIEWSMRGKVFSKENLPDSRKKTFESRFDEVIRNGNWNETHGIIIGPESSRIFAEIILQSADRSIQRAMQLAGMKAIVRRYVDDYFIFTNEVSEADKIQRIVETSLLDLNLHLNPVKTQTVSRPFLSTVSTSRSKVADVLNGFFELAVPLVTPDGEIPSEARIDRARSSTMKKIRRIAVELNVPYESFSSFALAVIERKLKDCTPSKDNPPNLGTGHLSRLSWLIAVLRISQFMFSIDKRVNTSLKLAKIYFTAIQLAELLQCARGPIEGQMLDGLRRMGKDQDEHSTDQIAKINHIAVVDILLTSGPRIEPADAIQHLGINKESLDKCSYFQLTSALFLFRRRHRFDDLRRSVVNEIIQRLKSKSIKFTENTELALLLTDFLSCPYIDQADKIDVFTHSYKQISGANCTKAEAIALMQKSSWICFTDWTATADLAKMLARKELTPAYE